MQSAREKAPRRRAPGAHVAWFEKGAAEPAKQSQREMAAPTRPKARGRERIADFRPGPALQNPHSVNSSDTPEARRGRDRRRERA